MAEKTFPLEEISIEQLFNGGGDKTTYEIPIYQRNYAWEKDEISALIHDVYDAYRNPAKDTYYIGTLVSYNKGDRVFEVIDGQQRLTTIRLILDALGVKSRNKLTYRARKKSDYTLENIHHTEMLDEKDSGIENGYKFAALALDELGLEDDKEGFISFFLTRVHIIHYQVPKDIDLNHYFEIMNSRGEQLEKHEIVKANLMEKLDTDEERKVFNRIWECCSAMSTYTQQNLDGIKPEEVFGSTLYEFLPKSFDDILGKYHESDEESEKTKAYTITELLENESIRKWEQPDVNAEKKDSFQPIIDYTNFLLIVLKLSRMKEVGFCATDFYLDDKELLNEFSRANMDSEGVKAFAFNLLKARFLLDNYVVHHSKEEDTIDSNPWKLQVWYKDPETKKGRLKNLEEDRNLENKLTHLLSMFEVSFTARQRKNYLFYCLFYLMGREKWDVAAYTAFVEHLADRFFREVYLDAQKLNAKNTPGPGSFDDTILDGNNFSSSANTIDVTATFNNIYGNGETASKGVPLFIFNYLDYRLWKIYDSTLRGGRFAETSAERDKFFKKTLGCGDFGLKVFEQFYFSRTRRSLEHYYPQANANGKNGAPDQNQINCFGNYAMIGSEANSSGSNWSPKTKLDHYLDASGKISQISVASLKFMIMMQMCKDRSKWDYEEILFHQKKMLEVLDDGVAALPEDNNIAVSEQQSTSPLIGEDNETSRSAHVMNLVRAWGQDKEKLSGIIVHPESCTQKFFRFTTEAMSEILPDATEAKSGWKTRNHYYYEIVNYDGERLRTQLAFSGNHIPDKLKNTCEEIFEIFPPSKKGRNWKWVLPARSKKADISESTSDDEIIKILDEQFRYIMECESQIVEYIKAKHENRC